MLPSFLVYILFLWWERKFPLKRQYTSTRLHGVKFRRQIIILRAFRNPTSHSSGTLLFHHCSQTFLVHMNAFLCCRIYFSFNCPVFIISRSYLRNVPLPLPGGENPLTLRTSNSAIGLNKDSEAATSPSATTGLYCTVSSLLDPAIREITLPKRIEAKIISKNSIDAEVNSAFLNR